MWLPPSLGTPPVSIFAVVDEASYNDGEKAGNLFVGWPQANICLCLGRRVFLPPV